MIYKIVKIKWVDSATYREWYSVEELSELNKVPIVESIGFLIKKGNNIILASNNDNNQNFSGITIIPEESIKEIKEVD